MHYSQSHYAIPYSRDYENRMVQITDDCVQVIYRFFEKKFKYTVIIYEVNLFLQSECYLPCSLAWLGITASEIGLKNGIDFQAKFRRFYCWCMVAASSCQILNLLLKFSLKHFSLKHLCQNICEIVLIFYGDGRQSVQPKSNKLECITTSWLVAKSIRGIVLGFNPRLCNIIRGLIEAFWMSLPGKNAK